VSSKFYGQKWVYGELIPYEGGPFGWIGLKYLVDPACGSPDAEVSNASVARTSLGDPFASEPSEVSAKYRGTTWVWGIDGFAAHKPGWVSRKDLKLSSCDKTGCFYDINARNVREWYLPGGSAGP
jgi:hypothetical protein